MKTLGYYNGKFGPLEEMTVPMNDRACYFGDGVYEATLARNGKIFALKEHLDRFFNSAGLIKIDIPYTKDELAAILYDMLTDAGSPGHLPVDEDILIVHFCQHIVKDGGQLFPCVGNFDLKKSGAVEETVQVLL